MGIRKKSGGRIVRDVTLKQRAIGINIQFDKKIIYTKYQALTSTEPNFRDQKCCSEIEC